MQSDRTADPPRAEPASDLSDPIVEAEVVGPARVPIPPWEPEKVYSVPRRYDLSMMLVVVVAYALLFGVMKGLEFHPMAFVLITLFFTVIGVSQALLFRGENPRRASEITGGVFGLVLAVGLGITSGEVCFVLPMVFFLTLLGIGAGYMAGTLVGGIFLVADAVRKLIERGRDDRRAPGDESEDPIGPWDR